MGPGQPLGPGHYGGRRKHHGIGRKPRTCVGAKHIAPAGEQDEIVSFHIPAIAHVQPNNVDRKPPLQLLIVHLQHLPRKAVADAHRGLLLSASQPHLVPSCKREEKIGRAHV